MLRASSARGPSAGAWSGVRAAAPRIGRNPLSSSIQIPLEPLFSILLRPPYTPDPGRKTIYNLCFSDHPSPPFFAHIHSHQRHRDRGSTRNGKHPSSSKSSEGRRGRAPWISPRPPPPPPPTHTPSTQPGPDPSPGSSSVATAPSRAGGVGGGGGGELPVPFPGTRSPGEMLGVRGRGALRPQPAPFSSRKVESCSGRSPGTNFPGWRVRASAAAPLTVCAEQGAKQQRAARPPHGAAAGAPCRPGGSAGSRGTARRRVSAEAPRSGAASRSTAAGAPRRSPPACCCLQCGPSRSRPARGPGGGPGGLELGTRSMSFLDLEKLLKDGEEYPGPHLSASQR